MRFAWIGELTAKARQTIKRPVRVVLFAEKNLKFIFSSETRNSKLCRETTPYGVNVGLSAESTGSDFFVQIFCFQALKEWL